MQLEALLFEPSRRESQEGLARAIRQGYVDVVRARERLVAYAVACALADFASVHGPGEDLALHNGTALYGMALGVHPDFQRQGLARKLKRRQLARARAAGFDALCGRQRMPEAQAMWRLNRSLGATHHATIYGAYGDPHAQAYYYRIPLRRR